MIDKKSQPESDADLAQGIEDEMRAQMLLKDSKMLEDYLRLGFKIMIERMPRSARVLKEREARMKGGSPSVEALVQETRLRLTALAKSAPEQVSDTLKIVEIMTDQLEKRTGASEEKKQDSTAMRLAGMLKKDIWDEMMREAHQGKKE